MVKAIYIPNPKTGKLSYVSTSSFRLMRMTSFLLKTIEKIQDRRIRVYTLVEYPLQMKQLL